MRNKTVFGAVLTLVVACHALTAPDSALAAPATASAKKKRAPVKVTASQLWMRLDTIEAQLEAVQKSLDEMGKSTSAAAAAAAARPTVQMPGPGEGTQAREMAGAFYNHGVYRRRAANMRLAATLIRDVTLIAGGITAVVGWENGRNKTAPRTIGLAYKEYRGFTIGITTAAIGLLVSEIVNVAANRAEASAAKALMRPLEEEPSGPAPAVDVK